MAISMSKKKLLKITIDVVQETCELYSQLLQKSKFRDAKNIFTKLYNDHLELMEYLISISNSLTDNDNEDTSFDIEFPDKSSLYKKVKASWWHSKDSALVTGESIQKSAIIYLALLKKRFPGLADDILDEVMDAEERQVEFLLDVHFLYLINNIMM